MVFFSLTNNVPRKAYVVKKHKRNKKIHERAAKAQQSLEQS